MSYSFQFQPRQLHEYDGLCLSIGGQSSPSFELFSPRTYCWCSKKTTVRHIPVSLQKARLVIIQICETTNICAVVKLYLIGKYTYSVVFLPRQHLYYVYCVCIKIRVILKKTIEKDAFYPKHNRTIV